MRKELSEMTRNLDSHGLISQETSNGVGVLVGYGSATESCCLFFLELLVKHQNIVDALSAAVAGLLILSCAFLSFFLLFTAAGGAGCPGSSGV